MMGNMPRFSSEAEDVLRHSGWFPGRRADIQSWKELLPGLSWHEAAEGFLAEFGGLSVDVSGPGVSCAREPFEIDPELAVGEEGRFEDLSERFGRRFLPSGRSGRSSSWRSTKTGFCTFWLPGCSDWDPRTRHWRT